VFLFFLCGEIFFSASLFFSSPLLRRGDYSNSTVSPPARLAREERVGFVAQELDRAIAKGEVGAAGMGGPEVDQIADVIRTAWLEAARAGWHFVSRLVVVWLSG